MSPTLIGRRTRRRGALDKSVTFALARAARLAAAPPLPSSFGHARDVSLVGPFAFVAQAVPWESEAPPVVGPSLARTLVVACEGRFFGGSYELFERQRRSSDPAARLVASDVFVSVVQVERARRAGADAVAPLVRASAFEDVAGAAHARQMAILPECSSAGDVDRALAVGAKAVLISLRDRDSHRPDVVAAAATLQACRAAGLVTIALFASSLDESLRGRAAALRFDHVAC